jgi:hypothetical protein
MLFLQFFNNDDIFIKFQYKSVIMKKITEIKEPDPLMYVEVGPVMRKRRCSRCLAVRPCSVGDSGNLIIVLIFY